MSLFFSISLSFSFFTSLLSNFLQKLRPLSRVQRSREALSSFSCSTFSLSFTLLVPVLTLFLFFFYVLQVPTFIASLPFFIFSSSRPHLSSFFRSLKLAHISLSSTFSRSAAPVLAPLSPFFYSLKLTSPLLFFLVPLSSLMSPSLPFWFPPLFVHSPFLVHSSLSLLVPSSSSFRLLSSLLVPSSLRSLFSLSSGSLFSSFTLLSLFWFSPHHLSLSSETLSPHPLSSHPPPSYSPKPQLNERDATCYCHLRVQLHWASPPPCSNLKLPISALCLFSSIPRARVCSSPSTSALARDTA